MTALVSLPAEPPPSLPSRTATHPVPMAGHLESSAVSLGQPVLVSVAQLKYCPSVGRMRYS